MKRIGIVAGMPAELAAFAPATARARVAGPIVVETLMLGAKQCFLACAGIGKVASASAAALLVHRYDVELLMVIGTAARIGLGPGGAFRIVDAVQSDYGARSDSGFARFDPMALPFGIPPALTPYKAFELHAIAAVPPARIASADMFVESAGHAAEIGMSLGATLIDMETAAVAQFATLNNIPWAAIKAATDAADEDSAATFLDQLARAARAAAEAAEQAIAAL
ncbi:5'-methylthioadenosine/S-adenosylhomocysteine nucleosidase [Sphingomonas montanisoli]|uniref:5'-methylthioadenosine/S-adenosylhomocysteine nucleosidase n=1 Tax=Sphingomonas montanisoli TaxID=2606412 RepID=A0A5D9CCN7_9SPHN|nr:5'-methylthioadenosine/S-adenosylhomocysteine nucleosidase [Sphingomonas montanisoli]TZG29023.1 5'-methylthioadenosine/S-adenosylhomocysteine nucleosidase [Sphingomonas montanisoli]